MTEDPYLPPKADISGEGPRAALKSGCGFLFWAAFPLIGAAGLLIAMNGLEVAPRFLGLFGIVQLLYIVPLCIRARRAGLTYKLAGLICGASLVFLISVPCLGTGFPSP